MNSVLAAKLLSSVMGWNTQQTEENLPMVRFMADMKYDSYDQYMPGNRFMASFIRWLYCFQREERQEMYDLVMKKLIFISSTQMSYLVDLMYNSKIKAYLINKVADQLSLPKYKCSKILNSNEFKVTKRKCLILGLSDGAHTDILRRSAEFNNEQVLTLYYPSEDKVRDMLSELEESCKNESNPRFTSLFLIDDFTASGTSFIRKEGDEEKYKGKLFRILQQFKDTSEGEKVNCQIRKLMIEDGMIDIHICFCIATEYARKYIENMVRDYLTSSGLETRLNVQIDVVQMLRDDAKIDKYKEPNLYKIIQNPHYFDSELVVTSSYKKGKYDEPYLGYNEGALPLVLAHNTPNNSLPILWQATTKEDNVYGVFPRISRH